MQRSRQVAVAGCALMERQITVDQAVNTIHRFSGRQAPVAAPENPAGWSNRPKKRPRVVVEGDPTSRSNAPEQFLDGPLGARGVLQHSNGEHEIEAISG